MTKSCYPELLLWHFLVIRKTAPSLYIECLPEWWIDLLITDVIFAVVFLCSWAHESLQSIEYSTASIFSPLSYGNERGFLIIYRLSCCIESIFDGINWNSANEKDAYIVNHFLWPKHILSSFRCINSILLMKIARK